MANEPITDKVHPIDSLYRKRRNRTRLIDFEELGIYENPIPLEIRDKSDVAKLFKWFVPYSFINEYSADAFQEWLINIADLSPTHGSIKKKKLTYAFGGEIKFELYEPGGFSIGEPGDISEAEQRAFAEELISFGLDAEHLRTLAKNVADDFLDTGTAWIEVVRGTSMGKPVGKIHWHDTRTVRFWHEIREGIRYVGLSNKWDFTTIKNNTPKLMPVYPYWDVENGIERTFIQVKNGKNFWYGRPTWLQALYPVYNEMKDAEYLIKSSNNNFISKYIIEAAAYDEYNSFIDDEASQELGYDNFHDQLKQETTAAGDNPSAFLVTERPQGAEPMKVFELKPQSNSTWFKETDTINRKRVLEAHDWNEYLMGETTPTGMNNTAHLQNLKIAEGTVLNKLRKNVWDPINLAIREILTFHGNSDVRQKVTSQNPLQYLIEMLDEAGMETEDLGSFRMTREQRRRKREDDNEGEENDE